MTSVDRDSGQRQLQRLANERLRQPRTIVVAVAAGIVGLGLLAGSYTVSPNQVACTRTFGIVNCGSKVQLEVDGKNETSYSYIGPGLHFTWPLMARVDKIQVSQRLTDLHAAKLTLGQQNQPAEIDYQVLVNIPVHGTHRRDGQYVDSVYHLMYEVGQLGSGDVDMLVDRYIDAGLNKAFAPIEPDDFSSERNAILAKVSGEVAGDLAQLGVLMDSDVKVSRAELQGAWKEAATMRVQSIGRKNAAQNDADALKSRGEGEANQERARAKGHADAVNTQAEADANYITKMRAAFGGDDNALSIFLLTKSGTALPQVLGSQGIQIVPNVTAARPAPVPDPRMPK